MSEPYDFTKGDLEILRLLNDTIDALIDWKSGAADPDEGPEPAQILDGMRRWRRALFPIGKATGRWRIDEREPRGRSHAGCNCASCASLRAEGL